MAVRLLNEIARIKIGSFNEISKTIQLVQDIATGFSKLFGPGDSDKVTFTDMVPRHSLRN
jgi:hypothetical protein